MNEARFTIFAEDYDSMPHISRSIPAALDGLIDDKKFQDFADQLDALLGLLDAEHARFKIRYRWTQYGIYSIYPAILLIPNDFFMIWFFTWIIYLASVRLYTKYCRQSPKSIDEIVKEIRSVCQVMTDRTPHVSFHPMFRPFSLGSRNMDSIEWIHVSISDAAFVEVLTDAAFIRIDENDSSGVRGPAVCDTFDYQQLEVV